MFPLFPWLASFLFGAGTARILERGAVDPRGDGPLVAAIVAGAALAYLGCESLPGQYRFLHAHDWLLPAARAAHRLGIALVLVGVMSLASRTRWPVLDRLGRDSLFVYCAHLELAYGVISRPIARALTIGEWAIALGALVIVLYLVVRVRSEGTLRRWLRPPPALI
jgi:uncharacterized membrane protein